MALIVNVPTGQVEGQFVVGVVDGDGENSKPHYLPARGQVVFTATAPYVPNPVASPNPVTMLKKPIVALLDNEGYLCTPTLINPEIPGRRGIRLAATDNASDSVKGWTWEATPRFVDEDGATIPGTIPTFTFALPGNSTVDLTTVVKVPASTGIGEVQTGALAAAAQAAAREAASDAAAAKASAASANATATASRAEIPSLVSQAVASDPGVAGAAAAAVTNELKGRDLVEGTDPRLPSTTPAHAKYASVVTDGLGRIASAITYSGTNYLPAVDIDRAEAIDLHVETLRADNFTQSGQTVETKSHSEYAQVTVDQSNRIAENALDASGRVPDWVLKKWSIRMLPLLRLDTGITPEVKLAAFGDSMTAGDGGGGTRWPTVAANALGMPFYNGGISGQTSTEIALRQGGYAALVTVTGDQIPASGPVEATIGGQPGTWRTGRAWDFPGTLAGVPGKLTKSTTDTWTFTRSSAGGAVVCPPNSRFFSSVESPHNGWVSVFWAGRNLPSETVVPRDIASMVAAQTALKPRFLVLAVCNSGTEPAGSAGYKTVQTINTVLANTYRDRFFDVRRYLIDSGLSAAGITPTDADNKAISEDRIPPSLLADNLHLVGAGYTVVGQKIAALITEKGWNK